MLNIIKLSELSDNEFIKEIKKMNQEEVESLLILRRKLNDLAADLDNYLLDM